MNRLGLLLSVIFHLLVLLFGIATFNHHRVLHTQTPIPVELLPIEKLTRLKEMRATQRKKVLEVKDQKASKDIIKEFTQKQEQATETPHKKETPLPEKVTIKEKALKKDQSKVENPTKEKNKNKKDTDAKQKKAEDPFLSVLKTVEDLAPERDEKAKPTKKNVVKSDNIVDKLSLSELDALRQQLAKCWTIPAGAKGIQDLAIEVFVIMNPDATVQKASVKSGGNNTPYFRSAAESAKRALYHPECTPLLLPKGKYEEWHTFTIIFNPKEMFG